jgi:hypothetical protein
MSGNLGYDRLREFEQQVTQIFEHNSLLRFFPMMKVGDGKQTIQKKFPMPISMTKAEKEILTRNIEKFYAAPGEFRLPRVERTIELSNDEFDAMVSEGELSGLAERAAMDFAMNVDRDLIWQNSANITKIPFYGLYDAGTSTGTTARPIVVLTSDPGAAFSSAGVAAAAIANLLQIESYSPFIVKNRNGLNKENSGLVVCIPDIAMPSLNQVYPSTTVGAFVKDMFQSKFREIVVLPKDPGGLHIHSGAAETNTAFSMVSFNPEKFVFVYDKAYSVRAWDSQDSLTPRHYISFEAHGGLVPIPHITAASSIYKACVLQTGIGA